MEGFKGTPGPWYCRYNGNYFDISPKGEIQTLSLTHQNIYLNIDKDVEEANASLIAAAPELLEALQKVKAVVDSSEHWWMDSPDRGGIDMQAVDSAIAKALGTSNA